MTIGVGRNTSRAKQSRNAVGGYAEFLPTPQVRPWLEYLWVHVTPEGAALKLMGTGATNVALKIIER